MQRHSFVSEAWFPSSKRSLTLFAAVTNECNLHCSHCFAEAGVASENELSTEEWKTVIEQLRKVKGKKIFFFTGGEPLCRNDIYELIQHCIQHGDIGVVLGTNGTLIDEQVAARLKEVGLRECRLSLDGSNERVNAAVRGQGAFQRALEGLLNIKRTGMRVTVRTTIMKSNYNDLINIGELLEGEGVATWELKHLIPRGRARLALKKLALDQSSRMNAVCLLINEMKKGRFKKLQVRFMEGTFNFLCDKGATRKDVTRCPAGKRMLLIRPNGDVIPCGYLSNWLVGNIRNDTIYSLWPDSPTLVRLRKRAIRVKCVGCEKFDLCEGGCLAYDFCPIGKDIPFQV